MTYKQPIVKGRTRPIIRGIKPKVNDDIRFCTEDGCNTKLTRYNLKDKCYVHQVKKPPRLRGRKSKHG